MSARLETPEAARARLERAVLDERERAQLWERIAQHTQHATSAPRRRAVRAIAIAAPAFAVAAALWLLFANEPGRVPAGKPAVVADGCALDGRARELQLPARCGERAVHVGDDEWQLAAGTAVARTDRGAQLHSGRVRFKVHKRAPGTQFRVAVSHGEVRVVGTVFVVEQHDGRGSVAVSEGVIEFVWHDGTRERVAAGQRLQWPRQEPVPAITGAGTSTDEGVHADAGVSASAVATAVDAGREHAGREHASPDLDRVMERLLQLRSQQREREAVALLRKTLQQAGLGKVQRERISYELGLALEASGLASCAHWQRHIERFGSGLHASALAERVVRCR